MNRQNATDAARLRNTKTKQYAHIVRDVPLAAHNVRIAAYVVRMAVQKSFPPH